MVVTSACDFMTMCVTLSRKHAISVDTEFVGNLLCVVQIAATNEPPYIVVLQEFRFRYKREEVEVIMAPLRHILQDRSIVKVFHAPRQDISQIYHSEIGAVPCPVFDTQAAAEVVGVGHKKQLSYADLVYFVLGLRISKCQRLSNWKCRQLSAEQCVYAACDVVYLLQVYLRLADEMRKESMYNRERSGSLLELFRDEMREFERAELFRDNAAGSYRRSCPRRITW